jgi:hypothetical protein
MISHRLFLFLKFQNNFNCHHLFPITSYIIVEANDNTVYYITQNIKRRISFMNSMSRYYRDNCDPCNKNDKQNDYYDCRENDKKTCETIIKCGCPRSTTLPLVTVSSDFTVASVTLDTSKLRNPCVKLEFASNLVTVAAITGTLSFQVYKQCENQLNPIPIGPSWIYEPVAVGSDTFSFFTCDCDCSCDKGCCTYSVVVTTTVTAGTISVNNATLGAIATCGCSC